MYPKNYDRKYAKNLTASEKVNYTKSIQTDEDIDRFMSEIRKHTVNPDHEVFFAEANTNVNALKGLAPDSYTVILNRKTRYITVFKQDGSFVTAYQLKPNQLKMLIEENKILQG